MNRKLFEKGDIIVIAIAVIVSAILLIPKFSGEKQSLVARITVNGEAVEEIDLSSLSESKTVIPQTAPGVIIRAEKNAIYFESAECRDRLCVASGKLTRRGDTAVCLPSRTVITVLGAEVDAVTY